MVEDPLRDVGPAVVDEVLLGEPCRLELGEVADPFRLPARFECREPVRVDRAVAAQVDGRRRALKDVELPAVTPQRRCDLDARGPGADQADLLVGELGHRLALVITTGYVVVPTSGVEGRALERLDSGDPGQLRTVQRTGTHGDVRRGNPVAVVVTPKWRSR